jgi:hypothetical protein
MRCAGAMSKKVMDEVGSWDLTMRATARASMKLNAALP